MSLAFQMWLLAKIETSKGYICPLSVLALDSRSDFSLHEIVMMVRENSLRNYIALDISMLNQPSLRPLSHFIFFFLLWMLTVATRGSDGGDAVVGGGRDHMAIAGCDFSSKLWICRSKVVHKLGRRDIGPSPL
ncbi:heat-inducible transcription repressor HrcA [Sesbania bispinosa]|nr:heat-inducible transcription repressor HrcA [Sesbania bispinosa]